MSISPFELASRSAASSGHDYFTGSAFSPSVANNKHHEWIMNNMECRMSFMNMNCGGSMHARHVG